LVKPDLIKDITGYDMDSLDEATVTKLGKYFQEKKDTLTPALVEKSNLAAGALFKWIQAAHDFYYVNRKVKPKKAALEIANKQADQLKGELSVK
jgi:dynein heavy chain, axonemal